MKDSTRAVLGPKKVAAKRTAARRTTAKSPLKSVPSPKPGARDSKETSPSPDSGPKVSPVSRTRARVARKSESAELARARDQAEPSLSIAQAQVVASKFAGPETLPTRKPRPSLPSTYGESRLLLLLRDPHTLFAAWDMSREAVEGLKARIGRRGFAVSTLTLRMTPFGGPSQDLHLGKRTRSRYLRIEGGPSFIAEIGFTTPSGRFEFVARSAPCFVPPGVNRGDQRETSGPRVLSYRDAITHGRRGVALSSTGRPRPPYGSVSRSAPNPPSPPPVTVRVLGGASDLYRR